MNPIEEKAEKYAEGAWPAQVNAYERGGRVGARNGYLAGHAAALSEHEGGMEKGEAHRLIFETTMALMLGVIIQRELPDREDIVRNLNKIIEPLNIYLAKHKSGEGGKG